MPEPTVTSSLARELGPIPGAGDARRMLASLLTAATAPLIVAIVGPSGTGKSTLFNALAGADLSETGVLRPTTLRPVTWQADDRPLQLVDTPPSDRAREPLAATVATAHVVLAVTTPERYADASTWSTVRAARDEGAPVILVLNRLRPSGDDAVRHDVIERAGDVPVVIVTEAQEGSDPAPDAVVTLLEVAADRADELRAVLRHRLAGMAAAAIRELCTGIRLEQERRAMLVAGVSAAVRDAAAPVVVPGVGREFTDAVGLVGEEIEARSDRAVEVVRRAWAAAGTEAPEAMDRGALRAGDAPALGEWRDEVAAAAVDRVRPRWMRRVMRRTVAAVGWRSSLDPTSAPPWWVRPVVGDRLPGMRSEAAARLESVVAARVDARLAPFHDALPAVAPFDADRLEALAGKLGDDHPPSAVPRLLDDRGDG